MRQAAEKFVRISLIALFGWSALGIQLDVLSGPLSPEAALGELCELVLPCRASSREQTAPSGRFEHDRVSALVRSNVCTAPLPVVETATWPNPLIHAHTVPGPVTRLDANPLALPCAFSAVDTASFLDAATPAALDASSVTLRLCRLDC